MIRCLLCVMAILLLSVLGTHAAEQRCTELGTACVCSEPLNTNNAVNVSGSWYNPADSITKECKGELANGASVTRNASAPQFTADSAALAALPVGHAVSFIMRGASGHTGIFYINNGNEFSSPFPKRYAVRFYRYYSSNYDFKDDNGTLCENSKLAEPIGAGHPHGDNGQGQLGWYDYTGYTSPVVADCCNSGPGQNHNFNKAYWRGPSGGGGVWTRHEVVVVNPAGGAPGNGLYFVHYVKDVTNNGTEFIAADSRIAGAAGVYGISAFPSSESSGFTPNAPWRGVAANNYRQGTCNGYSAWSHYMVASWTTDAGQRIGAATEIEGGTGGGGTPPTPSNLKFSVPFKLAPGSPFKLGQQ